MAKACTAILRLACHAALFVIFLVSCRSVKAPESKATNANILLITLDTTRPDHLSPYGAANPTPNLAAIAERGILFENAFSQAPLTFPSHTSILTGLFPVHTGIHNNGLEIFNQPQYLLGNLLRQNGYKTGAVVSSFVLDRKFGLAGSFDVFDDRMERLPGLGTNFEVERRGDETYNAALQVLQGFAGKKWFLWLHFYDPHTPYEPPSPYEGYDGEIAFVDLQIGKLLEWLRSQKLDENTIVAVFGDHGESLGDHGEVTHGFFVYNSTLKVPFLLSYPLGKRRAKIGTAVASVDIVPTILDLTGIRDTQKRDGESLLPIINGQERQNDIYFESRYPELMGWNVLQGIVHQNWKFIATTRSELYDWQKDGSENTNLFTQNERVTRQLKTTLAKFEESATSKSQAPDAETLERLKSLGYVAGSTTKGKGNADPKDKIAVWAEFERIALLQREGKNHEALNILKDLAEKEPANNFLRVSLGRQYRQVGKIEESIHELRLATEMDPSDEEAYYELAIALKEARNHAEAIRAQQAAIVLQPERSEYHSFMGILLVETGKFENAIKEFSEVLKIDPNNAVAWNNYGNALRETNRLEEAIAAYRKSIELSPHYAYPKNGLGTIFIRQDRVREAVPYLQKAIELDPEFLEVYLNLGIAYQTLGEKEKAKTLYKAFLKLAPEWMKDERRNANLLLSQLT